MGKLDFNKLLKEAQFHGGVRLAEKRYSACWAIALLALFGTSVTIVYLSVVRFMENPTYLVQYDKIEEVTTFPSVIVCPEIHIHEDKIEEFLNKLKYPENTNISIYLPIMRQIEAFYSVDALYKTNDLMKIEELLNYNNINMYDAGFQLYFTCEETLIKCRWSGKITNCSELFRMELTGDGYCCVFNGRSLLREMKVFGHTLKYLKHDYTTIMYGYTSGLMLAINQQTQMLDNINLGYKWLALQGGQHYVETSLNGTPLNIGVEQWNSYHFRSFQIAEEARSLSDTLRGCIMGDEPLKYFPVYHKCIFSARKEYCILECEMAYTLMKCKCVRLIHPRPPGVKHCTAKQLICAQRALKTLDAEECMCPPACDVALDYIDISSYDLVPDVPTYDPFYDGLNFSKITIVRAYIGQIETTTKSRESYFSAFDLFAQLGGVFNVFFGCSVLTILELLQLSYRGLIDLYASRKNCKKSKIIRIKCQKSKPDKVLTK